ncbi:MAG: ATP-dependent DNA helicase [Thermoplasmata archaeon]
MEIFPYKFRKYQKDLIEFIERNSDRYNICIQAPTGFGKTIIVLSSLIKKNKKIVWVVRTGTETDRPIEELKIINEKKGKKYSGLSFRGKRDMCLYINDKLKEKDLNYDDVSFFCEKNRKNCPYYRNLQDFNSILGKTMLYSEILEFSKLNRICPYYYQRKIAPYVDVLSINYNYIINRNILYSLRNILDIKDAYLVLDEAHNLQFASMNINSDYISTVSIERGINELEDIDSEKRSDAWEFLNDLRLIISRYIGKKREIEIDFEDFINEIKNLDEGIALLKELGTKIRNKMLKEGKRPASSLYHISEFLETSIEMMHTEGIVFFIKRERNIYSVEMWDMRSSAVLSPLWKNFRSNIFMSGTLEPINGFVEVIGLGNYKAVKVDYEIKPEKIKSFILYGLSTKGERISKDMVRKYETVLKHFIEKLNDRNIAIFSASYRIQDVLVKLVPEDVRDRIFIEKEGMSGNESRKILDSFKRMAYSDKKGILFASASGRFAEGADFPGKELEGVFLAGIPFEKLTIKTELYIKYFENIYGENGRYYAYVVPALRRASQALGRVIRSEDDYGIFVLADERFSKDEYFNLLPSYIKNNSKLISYDEFLNVDLKIF